MVKCGVFFAVRTELLNIILASFDFKGLITFFYWYASYESGNNGTTKLTVTQLSSQPKTFQI
jgi:hypothetical protein